MNKIYHLPLLFVVSLVFVFAGCAHPTVKARSAKKLHYEGRDYAASTNDVYYAIRWSLKQNGYSVAKEDLPNGVITTAWKPVTSDSHYVPLFGRRDYGVTNSYYRLIVDVIPGGGRNVVKVASVVKSLVAELKSSGVEERKVLDGIANYLRVKDPDISNLGIAE